MVEGYTDSPVLPNSEYHVHDPNRPQPVVVTPGNLSDLPPVTPPSDAEILFDGSKRLAENWVQCKDESPLAWQVENGYMEVVAGTGNIQTKQTFGDIQLHVEWAAPFEIQKTKDGNDRTGQGRGNSGVFLHGKYEIQVLDNWNNPTYADGQLGSIYGEFPPLVNAACKRGSWNIYDILWTAPKFDGDKLVSPAYVTVMLNGVCVQNHTELIGPTGHRDIYEYQAHGDGPVMLQDHGNPVRFRNIWVRELKPHDAQ
jgi:hypothetical protein